MEIFRFNIIPTEEFMKREAFRQSVQNCSQCGKHLEFNYQQLKEESVLQEDSKCSHCAHEPESTRHRVH